MVEGIISSSWRHQVREKFVELGSSHVEPLIEPFIEQFASNGDKRQTRRNIIDFPPIPHTDIARVSIGKVYGFIHFDTIFQPFFQARRHNQTVAQLSKRQSKTPLAATRSENSGLNQC